jgi:TolB-like protein/Tfp pilus assembly protein PilF
VPLKPNQRVGSYEIVCPLGAGGMGEVYRARDSRLGRDVALKVLPPEMTSEPGRLERFDREARAIAALNHPHIVTIYSTEDIDGLRFLTMELVDGATLSDLVTTSGMTVARFLDIAVPLADALAAAHHKQITHRDLKPGNVMVSNDGRVKVLDFGLARIGSAATGEQTMVETVAPITHHGTIVGTMPYMSPEQVEGRSIDARSDLFSLGVIFYELLSGKRPFSGGSSPALMSSILRDTPPPISATRADLPDGLERLVDRLIEKRPEDRVQTARDVFNELKHFRKQIESSSVRSSGASGATVAPPHNLWIAVLPFSVRGADPDAVDLAAGLSDDIAAGLARFHIFNVVAAQSTRAYQDSPLDVRQIADRLGARYVIGGNIRKSSRSVRVTAQLIDAASGAQLWNESYDRDASAMDLFAIQDDVTDHIVATVGDHSGVLARSMAKSVRSHLPAAEQTSRELLLRTWGLRHDPVADEHAALRAAIEARLDIEPDNADLWAELAHLYLDEHILALNPMPGALERAARAARRAVAIDPNHQCGWTELAATCFFNRDAAGLFDGAERAIAINPRNANNLAWMGNLLTHAGEYERGSTLTERAMAINPRHAGWLHFAVFNRQFAAGNYQEALRTARRINMPQLNWTYFAIAAAAAHLGLMDEARQAAAKMIEITPALSDPQTLREYTARWFWKPEMLEALLEGVYKAQSEIARPGSVETAPPKPPSSHGSGSIVSSALTVTVRPFVSRSADDESKALADALTDDITTGLSRFGYLRVAAAAPAERPSHARYAIEGNVRRAGSTLRISVTLVDTQAATNLWTNIYDRDLSQGAFAIQDDVSSAAVATIGDQTGVLVRAIANNMADRPIDQLSVGELVIRYHLYAENFHPDEHRLLRDALQRALAKEPRAAEGWACLAMLHEHEHGFHFNELPDAQARQRRAAERALEADPRSQMAWIAMASAHAFGRDREALKAAVERGVDINPLNADLVALGGVFLSIAGEHERARTLVQAAMRLKPQHPGWYHFPMFNAHYASGDYESALRENKKANMPRMPFVHLSAAAVAGHLGRVAEARAAMAGLRSINPALAEPDGARAFWTIWIWDERWIDSLVDGFKKAKAIDERSAVRSSEQSIAVLPFTDLSEKKDQDWFCDGIAEEIMNALAALPDLRVAARTSAFSFRGKTDDLRAIGDKLNVATVLDGSVRRSGDRVRITTRLSDTKLGRQLWSERFDRDLQDIFDVQDQIARSIADRLRVTIGGGDRLVQKATTNLEAYELMLKGRGFLNRRGPAIANAIPCFEQAIALDDKLAEAHAGLGDTYRLFGLYGLMPTHEARTLARRSLERALALDPDQVEALATLANIVSAFEWNHSEARALSDRALKRDPSHVRALAESAITIATSMADHPPEALRQLILDRIGRARALDPLNAWVMAIEAMVLVILGREQEAIDLAAKAVATDPDNFTAHWSRVFTLAQQDRASEAEDAAQPGLAMSSRHPMLLSDLATLHARQGEVEKAESIYQELRERSTTAFISPSARAIAAAAAGHMPEARALLAQALAEHDAFLRFSRLSAWRPIWADAECAAMLRNSPLTHHASA